MTSSQIRIEQRSPSYWKATFDHPPINLIDPAMVSELSALISSMETDPQLRVIVFESADPDFFLAHYDVRTTSTTFPSTDTPTKLHPWLDVLVRLSRCPVVSIAVIRGCARGAGSEFALACDLRFASRERARLGQFEIGVGAVPGGGPMARLSRMVGRGRALEIVLSGDDFPGELAERYGYVNRSLPDAKLDGFVDGMARRIAGFDKQTIADIKGLVNLNSLPPNDQIGAEWEAFLGSVKRPAAQKRLSELMELGLQTNPDVERRLPEYTGKLGQSPK